MTDQQPDPRPGSYYVSVQDGARSALLLGPFPTHQEALDMVEPVRAKGNELDPRAAFYAFGTARLRDDGIAIGGNLNKHFGMAA